LWSVINEVTDVKKQAKVILELNDDVGRVFTSRQPKEMANTINTFFSNVGEDIASKIEKHQNSELPTTDFNQRSMFLSATDETEISRYISDLPTNSAPGPDGFTADILKTHKLTLLTPLSYLINLSITTSTFPDAFKLATIIPIHKGGDKKNISNYRPISLISNIGKLFEKVVKKRITGFLENSNYMAENQYGFRSKRSAQDAIAKLSNHVLTDLDNKLFPLCVYLDLQKAFDTVSHRLLLEKAERAGLRGQIHAWLESYLTNRKQQTRITIHNDDGSQMGNIALSDTVDVRHGVPQGTVLGPLLFLIYINDLFNMDQDCTMVGFADDTALYFNGENWDDTYRKATLTLKRLKIWFDKNLLAINTKKTQYVAFSHKANGQPEENHTLKIHKNSCSNSHHCTCDVIKKVICSKYLGITMDQHMKWKQHLVLTSQRIRKTIYKFRRLRHILDIETLRQTYFALVHSLATYGVLVWGGAPKIHLQPVEVAVKAVLRVALSKPYRYPSAALYDEIKVPTITFTYLEELMSYRFKISYNAIDYINHGLHTRMAVSRNLRLPKPDTTLYKRSHMYLSAVMYNRLPAELKAINSINRFKREIKQYLKNNLETIKEYLSP
jgi:hypothetical protein